MSDFVVDSSNEYGCYEKLLKENIPDKYHMIDVTFGFIRDMYLPKQDPKEDNSYYIMIYAIHKDRIVDNYRISLYKPDYVFNSDKLSDDIRDIVIKTIIENYRSGLNGINEMAERVIFDIDRPMPDYTKLL